VRSRAGEVGLGEVILATGATVDGRTTAHYLTERLAGCDVTAIRVAQGVRWAAGWTISTMAP